MLNRLARAFIARLLTPVARAFLKIGLTPDAITIIGTLGVVTGALAFYPRGEFFYGTLFITAFVFADNLDGVMARIAGRESPWGAFLDSVLDRFGDAAIFSGLALYFAGAGENMRMAALCLAAMALAGVVSYVKARAESQGYSASVGIAERPDRLVAILATTGLVGLFGLPMVVLEVVLWPLVVASAITIGQRIATVRRQAREQMA